MTVLCAPCLRPLDVPDNSEFVHVYYSALNFRDIMTATGKLATEVAAHGRLNQECVQGLEFSGRTLDGRRVMGMMARGALTNMIICNKNLLWDIPDEMSLEDAVTIPVVYGTVLVSPCALSVSLSLCLSLTHTLQPQTLDSIERINE